MKAKGHYYSPSLYTPLKPHQPIRPARNAPLARDQLQTRFQGAASKPSQQSKGVFKKVTRGPLPKLVVGTTLLAAGLATNVLGLATVLAAPILVPIGLGLALGGALLMCWGGIQAYRQSGSKTQKQDSASSVHNKTDQTESSSPERYPDSTSLQNASIGTDPEPHQSETPLSFQSLYGTNDIRQIHFKQKSGTLSCYLLASLDSLMHHPAGRQGLEKIQFFKTGIGYDVKFPSLPKPIPVTDIELADRMVEGPLGIRLIEKAYLKTPGATLDEDNPLDAMGRIFGRQAVKVPDQECPQLHRDYFQQQTQTRESRNLDTWCAMKKGDNHWYSLRFEPEITDSVIKANPFNTKTQLERITIDELLNQYYLDGARILI